MFARLREYWQDYKAWRRGEYRVAPYGARGRVYARRNEEVPDASMQVSARTTYKTLARVISEEERPDEYYELSATNKLLTQEVYDNMREGKPNG